VPGTFAYLADICKCVCAHALRQTSLTKGLLEAHLTEPLDLQFQARTGGLAVCHHRRRHRYCPCLVSFPPSLSVCLFAISFSRHPKTGTCIECFLLLSCRSLLGKGKKEGRVKQTSHATSLLTAPGSKTNTAPPRDAIIFF
jgi:hypothetical protein